MIKLQNLNSLGCFRPLGIRAALAHTDLLARVGYYDLGQEQVLAHFRSHLHLIRESCSPVVSERIENLLLTSSNPNLRFKLMDYVALLVSRKLQQSFDDGFRSAQRYEHCSVEALSTPLFAPLVDCTYTNQAKFVDEEQYQAIENPAVRLGCDQGDFFVFNVTHLRLELAKCLREFVALLSDCGYASSIIDNVNLIFHIESIYPDYPDIPNTDAGTIDSKVLGKIVDQLLNISEPHCLDQIDLMSVIDSVLRNDKNHEVWSLNGILLSDYELLSEGADYDCSHIEVGVLFAKEYLAFDTIHSELSKTRKSVGLSNGQMMELIVSKVAAMDDLNDKERDVANLITCNSDLLIGSVNKFGLIYEEESYSTSNLFYFIDEDYGHLPLLESLASAMDNFQGEHFNALEQPEYARSVCNNLGVVSAFATDLAQILKP